MRSLTYDELFIGGRWQAPSTRQRISVISPHTEQPIGETPEAAPQRCRPGRAGRAQGIRRRAVAAAPGLGERMEKIEKLATVYTAQAEEMADLITAEMGSPRTLQPVGPGATAPLSQMYLTLATAKEFGVGRTQAGPVRPGSSAAGAGRRRRRDRAVERAPGADHAQADSRR